MIATQALRHFGVTNNSAITTRIGSVWFRPSSHFSSSSWIKPKCRRPCRPHHSRAIWAEWEGTINWKFIFRDSATAAHTPRPKKPAITFCVCRSHRPKPAFRKAIMNGDRRSVRRHLEISVASLDDPLAKAAHEIYRGRPWKTPTRFHGRIFGGTSTDEVYIYAPPLTVPAR